MTLRNRDRQPEWMDQPDLDFELHAQALRGLSRVNRISGTSGSIWNQITDLFSESASGTIRLLDVACGGGDTAIGLKRMADRKRVPLEIVGCDISETALAFARDEAARKQADVTFVQLDVLAEGLPADFDVVYSSLFLHHLDEETIIRLLGAMRSVARRRVVIDDLLRTRLGFMLAKWGIRLLTVSKVCHFDGPLSVRAALTVEEAERLSEAAGWTGVEIHRKWPERFVMVCQAE